MSFSIILLGEDGENVLSRQLPLAFKVEGKIWVNNHAHVIRPTQSIDIDYLTIYLESIDYSQYVSGSAQPKLNQNRCINIEIFCPPLPEQHRIATVLGTIDSCIEKTEALIAKLNSVKAGLMQDLLTRGIDTEGRIRDESTHEFKDTEIGRVPVEWDVLQLGDVLTLKRGYDLPERERKKGIIPIISSSGITGYHHKSMVLGPGIVTGRYGTIGEVFYVNEDFWPLNTTLYVTDFKGNNIEFLSILLKNTLELYLSDATTIPGINRNIIHKILVPVPNILEQKRIASLMKSSDELISQEKDYQNKLLCIKRGMMADLLTGNVRVPDTIVSSS